MNDMHVCPICGGENINFSNETHNLAIMGLPNVGLKGVPVHTCLDCGEVFKDYPVTKSFDEMIVKTLVSIKRDLSGKEMAFIRKKLGYSAKDWSKKIGVHNVTLSDWENEKKPINKTVEVVLRMHAALKFEMSLDEIESVSGVAIADLASMPITAPMLINYSWSNTSKRVVNG